MLRSHKNQNEYLSAANQHYQNYTNECFDGKRWKATSVPTLMKILLNLTELMLILTYCTWVVPENYSLRYSNWAFLFQVVFKNLHLSFWIDLQFENGLHSRELFNSLDIIGAHWYAQIFKTLGIRPSGPVPFLGLRPLRGGAAVLTPVMTGCSVLFGAVLVAVKWLLLVSVHASAGPLAS